MDKLKLKQNK